jgi:GMP synthase (glutamine-hydrolysing)
VNMLKIVLGQFRSDEKVLSHEKKCFADKLGIREDDLQTINLLGTELSEDDFVDADVVFLGGSGDYLVSQGDIPEVLDRVKSLLFTLRDKNVPTMGICFGSQVICWAFGGLVEKDESRQETGVFEISLKNEAAHDQIFMDFPSKFMAMLGHKDHLSELPEDAISLAGSERSPNQAFKLKNTMMYGVLFHPELSAQDMMFRLKMFADVYGISERDMLDKEKELDVDVTLASSVLNRFLNLVKDAKK